MNIYYNWARLKKWCVRNFNAAGRMSWKFRFKNFWYLRFGFLYPHNKKLRYKYVIVSPTYNVEPYIEDFYRSVVWQSGNFRKSVHIVTVDDGSTDGTAKIAKKWQRRYPQNITYLYRKNGGLPVTRNTGLKYVFENIEADFATFTDPDDFVNGDCFHQVDKAILQFSVMERVIYAHYRIRVFNERSCSYGIHPNEFKFVEKAGLLVNADSERNIMSSTPTFYPIKNIQSNKVFFDESLLYYFDDGKFAAQMILRASAAARGILVPNAFYFYRKRKEKTSLISGTITRRNYFLIFPLQCIRLLEERASYVGQKECGFLDYVMIYNFFWYFRAGEESKNARFHEQEIYDKSLALVREMFRYVASERIQQFNKIGYWYLDKVRTLAIGKDEEIGNPVLYCERIDLSKLEITFLTYIKSDDQFQIYVDGRLTVPNFRKKKALKCWNRVWGYELRLVVPYRDKEQIVTAKIRGVHCLLCNPFEQTYNKQLSVRSLYHGQQKLIQSIEPVQDPDTWLLLDRGSCADDNAEHLYRYIRQAHPEKKVRFALKRTSPDWDRLKREGFDLVPFGCNRIYSVAHRKASKIISSHPDLHYSCFVNARDRGSLKMKDCVFLQHGINRDDVSSWINNQKIDLFITATPQETMSIVHKNSPYKILPSRVKMTGFARHDTLLKKAKTLKKGEKSILVMPTWRSDILGRWQGDTYTYAHNEAFYQSPYALAWKSFLGNSRLRTLTQTYGYRIVFSPHVRMLPYLKGWDLPEYIIQEDCKKKSIQDLFVENDLMITDYSSVAFEMAYIRKPVVYYQFDKEHYFNSEASVSRVGYFDYHRDGFGPVAMTEDALLEELEKLLKRACQPAPQYLQRMKSTFPFRDGQCCERIYQAICDLDKPRQPDDFDHDTLVEYAENAEKRGDWNLAHKCWEKLFTYGNENRKNLAGLHSKFCENLLNQKIK